MFTRSELNLIYTSLQNFVTKKPKRTVTATGYYDQQRLELLALLVKVKDLLLTARRGGT